MTIVSRILGSGVRNMSAGDFVVAGLCAVTFAGCGDYSISRTMTKADAKAFAKNEQRRSCDETTCGEIEEPKSGLMSSDHSPH